jgi:hypothetical protein
MKPTSTSRVDSSWRATSEATHGRPHW